MENSFLRNTGDDSIALYSQNDADSNDTITQNTVDSPGLANNIGIYGGGSGDEITNNLLQDTVSTAAVSRSRRTTAPSPSPGP